MNTLPNPPKDIPVGVFAVMFFGALITCAAVGIGIALLAGWL